MWHLGEKRRDGEKNIKVISVPTDHAENSAQTGIAESHIVDKEISLEQISGICTNNRTACKLQLTAITATIRQITEKEPDSQQIGAQYFFALSRPKCISFCLSFSSFPHRQIRAVFLYEYTFTFAMCFISVSLDLTYSFLTSNRLN